jgi:hypothetical protein
VRRLLVRHYGYQPIDVPRDYMSLKAPWYASRWGLVFTRPGCEAGMSAAPAGRAVAVVLGVVNRLLTVPMAGCAPSPRSKRGRPRQPGGAGPSAQSVDRELPVPSRDPRCLSSSIAQASERHRVPTPDPGHGRRPALAEGVAARAEPPAPKVAGLQFAGFRDHRYRPH